MSIAEMSKTLRKEVLERLKEQYTNQAKGRTSDARLANFLDYTSTKTIRADTDTAKGRHESIMSRGAFDSLAADLSKVLATNTLTTITSKSLTSDITFDNFIEYLIKTSKISLGNNKTRRSDKFTYTGTSRIGTDAGLLIGKEILEDKKATSDKDFISLRNIPIGTLVKYYAEFIVSNLQISAGISPTDALSEVMALFNAGHLTGAFNARLVRALGLRKDNSGNVRFDSSASDSLASTAEVELNKIMKLITDADYLSSNLINDIELFVSTDKRLYSNKVDLRLTTEVQFKADNKAAGDLLTQAGHAVSDLTKALKETISDNAKELATEKALVRLYKNLAGLAAFVNKKVAETQKLKSNLRKEALDNLNTIISNTKAIEKIIESPGSRSVPQHIAHLVESTLLGVSVKPQVSAALVTDKLFKNKRVKPKELKQVKVKKPKIVLKSQSKVSNINTGRFYNLTSLQNLLNANLAQKIKENMGDGSRRDILNLRSGRLAESAKVERLSESRAGMITAFYTYMKNPYATFSDGGRQQYPKSRDPKLLISKSIREIAAAQVNNRLRAVLV